MIIDSEIDFKDIDYDKVSKYLGKYMTAVEILENKFEDLLYIDEEKMKEIKVKQKEMKDENNDENKVETLDTEKRGSDDENKVETLDTEKCGSDDENKVETLDTDVTLACDDGHRNQAHTKHGDIGNIHKEKVMEENEKEEATTHVTSACDDDDENKAHKDIRSPVRSPNDVEKRKMLGTVIEIMIILSMENHVYKFANEIRKQKDGGPIGLSLTGEVADCYLIQWDKKFLEKLKTIGIELILYERFKDDITVMLESLEKGSKFENGKLVIDLDKKENDLEKSDEEVTMAVILEVAESVDNMIKFTVDTPSMHENKKLAILDVEVKINKQEDNRLDFEFYEKPTKNKRVMLHDAALPSNQKRTILTQEGLRRLRNTKLELGKSAQVTHLNNYMLKLKRSGYSQKFRTEIVDSAMKAYEKMIEEDKNGTKPLYRSREWNREERNKKKKENKTNWYKNPKVEFKSVLFVPVTKGGRLAKEMQIREEELNKHSKERIKIVEGGGIKMSNILVEKNPFPSEKCERKKCVICSSDLNNKNLIPCNSSNVGYQLACETCKSRGVDKVYEGETARSARVRGAEHVNGFKAGRGDSALYKHKQTEHEHEEMQFSMRITKRFKDPLSRQANEAVRISGRGKNETLNSKNEFNHPPIARISVERSKKYNSGQRTPISVQ